MDSMSRWFVGSSMRRTSGLPRRTFAIATRIFQPPDRAPTSPSMQRVVEAEPVEHLPGAGLQLVAAARLVLGLHVAKPCQDAFRLIGALRIRERVLEADQLVVEVAEASASRDRLVENGPPGHLVDLLLEVADRELLRHGHVAVVGVLFARDEPEDRRLAGPVRADEADLLAGVELEGGVDEEDLPAVLLADARKARSRAADDSRTARARRIIRSSRCGEHGGRRRRPARTASRGRS